MKTNRILFIDDNHTDQRIVEIILRKSDVITDECLSPVAAPLKIEKNGYDAILVDYELPVESGVSVISRLQDKIHCPIYIVTAHDKSFVEEKVQNSGIKVDGIISKVNLGHNLRELICQIYGRT